MHGVFYIYAQPFVDGHVLMFVGESVMIPTSSSLFGRGSPSGDPGSTLAFFLFMYLFWGKDNLVQQPKRMINTNVSCGQNGDPG